MQMTSKNSDSEHHITQFQEGEPDDRIGTVGSCPMSFHMLHGVRALPRAHLVVLAFSVNQFSEFVKIIF